MGLFLLGIPLAMISAKVLHDDIKYTKMDLSIEKASSDLHTQYKQIENHFVDILRYSGAKCNFKKIGYNKYEIKDVHKGQYGGMERYLAEKGYYPQAIAYAKKLFDDIAQKENQIKSSNRQKQIEQFEKALLNSPTEDMVLTNQVHNLMIEQEINKKVKQLIKYFNSHNNKVYCNIIMNNPKEFVKHKQVWHIKQPKNYNVHQYFTNVCEELNIRW